VNRARTLRITLLGLAVMAVLLSGLLAACGASSDEESQSFTTSTTVTDVGSGGFAGVGTNSATTLNEWAVNVCSAHSAYKQNALRGSGALSRKLRRVHRERFEKGNWREDTVRLIASLRDKSMSLRDTNSAFIAALRSLRPARDAEAGRVRRSLIDSSIEGARDYADRLQFVATTKLGGSPNADEILEAGTDVLLAMGGAAEAFRSPATMVGASKHPALVRAFKATPACRLWLKEIAFGEAFVSRRAERCRKRGGFMSSSSRGGVMCVKDKKEIDSWTPKP
jgi:hypothetical protein